MQRRLVDLIINVGMPVLTGQFLFDWASNGVWSAFGHVPTRAILIFVVLLAWAAFRHRRSGKERTIR